MLRACPRYVPCVRNGPSRLLCGSRPALYSTSVWRTFPKDRLRMLCQNNSEFRHTIGTRFPQISSIRGLSQAESSRPMNEKIWSSKVQPKRSSEPCFEWSTGFAAHPSAHSPRRTFRPRSKPSALSSAAWESPSTPGSRPFSRAWRPEPPSSA